MMPDAFWASPFGRGREVGNGAVRQPFPQIMVPALTNGNKGRDTGGDKSKDKDRASAWLRNAMIALAVLAAAAAAVSYQAQYQLIAALKHDHWAAAVQAAIPDAGAAVFACLGIALALQGKRAIRTRVLNLACVGISVTMNALAVMHGGWRSLAVWIMAPAIYALASDTLIGVVRAWSIARHRELNETLADDDATPIATLGGLLLWLLRLSLAPKSTLAGFRNWVVEECPVAPGRRVVSASGSDHEPLTAGPVTASQVVQSRPRAVRRGGGTKTARFLALVTERHGPLAEVPLSDVSRIAAAIAPQADLNVGSARSVLRSRVLEAQPGIETTGGSA
jgi:hypothetical protein